MFGKTLKRIACLALSVTGVAACASSFTACETSHPQVEMQIEFNEKTYKLEYELYRKITPATVNHFLWLVANKYYDGLCIHDYDDSRMYTGGYSYSSEVSENGGLTYKEYYSVIQGYKNYASFPYSVWRDKEMTTPTYTLCGEFSNNKFTVGENNKGALKETFGSLSMYYESKNVDDEVYVKYQNADKKGEARRVGYEYNGATSLFFISLVKETKTNNSYCTFATLAEDSKKTLESLQSAIASYIAQNYQDDEKEFTKYESVRVNTDDPFLAEKSSMAYFYVPNEPITIKKMTVKKY